MPPAFSKHARPPEAPRNITGFSDCQAAYTEFAALCAKGDEYFQQQPRQLNDALLHYLRAIQVANTLPVERILIATLRKGGVALGGSFAVAVSSAETMAAQCCIKLGNDSTLAKALLSSAQQRTPNYWDAWNGQVDLFLTKADYAQVKQLLLKLLSSNKPKAIKQHAAKKLLALNQTHTDAFALADADFRLAFSNIDKKDPQMLAAYAKFLLEQGELAKAENRYQQALSFDQVDTEKAVLFFNLAQLKNRQGDVTAAIANFLEAAKLGCTAALFAAASLLDTDDADEKDMEQALSLYQKGISEGDVQAMYNFAYKLMHGENIAVDKTRAITLFEHAFKTWETTGRNPNHLHSASGALLELGNHYLQQGNHAAAIDYYQQAIELGQHRAYFGLITIHETQGQFSEAFPLLLKLLACQPRFALGHFIVGLRYQHAIGTENDYAAAKKHFMIAASLGERQAVLALLNLFYFSTTEIVSKAEVMQVLTQFEERADTSDEFNCHLIRIKSDPEQLKAEAAAHRELQTSLQMTAFNPNEDANTRIEQLLVALRTAEHTDTINISTVMIRIAGLLRQSKYVPTALLQKIIDVLYETICSTERMLVFSARSLANMWAFLRLLNVAIDNAKLKPIADVMIKQSLQKLASMSVHDLVDILWSATHCLPCDIVFFTDFYQLLHQAISQRIEELSGYHIALFLQCTAIAHFSQLVSNIKPIMLSTLIEQACLLAEKSSDIRELRQIFLGLYYFSSLTFEVVGCDIESSLLKTLQIKIEGAASADDVTSSGLQRRMAQALKHADPNMQEEVWVNTLPVDMMTGTGVPVQVHGPTHYLMRLDTDGAAAAGYQCKVVDDFKAHIICCGCHNKTVVVLPFYEIPRKTGEQKAYVRKKLHQGRVSRSPATAASLSSHKVRAMTASTVPREGGGSKHAPSNQ